MDAGTLIAERYEVVGRLAVGGMADVFAARDRRLQRDVAVKIGRGLGTTDRGRFDTETRLLASLQHPHLVQVFDAGVHEGDPYLVLQLAEGPTLGHLLCAGPLDEDRLASLGGDVAGALAHVHGLGIVHRDVKPANVLTAADGRWLLGDFGIARLVDDAGVTATGTAIGTPAYFAPEQVAGGSATPATDVYALGLVLLEAATGRSAFPGPWAEAARARLVNDPDVGAAPAAWRDLIAAMTARDPADRPPAVVVHERWAAPTARSVVPAPPTAGSVTVAAAPTRPLAPGRAGAPPVANPPFEAAATAGPGPVDPFVPDGTAASSSRSQADQPTGASGPSGADPTDAGVAPRGGRRRTPRRLVAIAAVALVLLSGFAWLRFAADGATASPPGPAPSSTTPSTTVAPAATPSSSVAVAVAETVPATVPPPTSTSVAATPAPTTPVTVAALAGNTATGACPPTTTTVTEPVIVPEASASRQPEPEPAAAC